MNLAEQFGAIPGSASHELGDTTGVVGGVGGDVVDAPVDGHPGVLALAARLAFQHGGRDAQVGRGGGVYATEVGVGAGDARPVEW